ncbi:imidazole glycerol phosphate synthase subunit HisF [Georgenia halophila]|uniref:Imidazole glycerol phosphate synthase subunit HisF n=1 Tax=Georgenia halophila TaxID=620889 RepID=A0ABP8L406_9MICO
MSVAVRVIPCLDVADGRVVKGVNFQGLRDAGDPVELARRYDADGADEITFLDVSASAEARETTMAVVSRTAEEVFVPLTVGGGVRSTADVDRLLKAGADKVGVNTAAIARPELITEIAERFGRQVLVLSVDARRVTVGDEHERGTSGERGADHIHTGSTTTPSGYEVTTHGGRTGTGIDAVEWAARGAELGAGEILLNSMDADGTTGGFDLAMLDDVRARVGVPLIASGGAGAPEHFTQAARHGADAVLAASVFHFATLSIGQVKDHMRGAGVEVR